MKNALLFCLLPLSTAAQMLPQPPALIRITQSPATSQRHPGDPANGIFVFGMTSETGFAETWIVETHGSFAGLEAYDEANGGRPPRGENGRALIAFYRHWWSHRPEEAMQLLPRSRYMQVSTYRIGLGSENELTNLLRARRASLDSINLDRPDLVYQVLSGAPSGTYLILSPLASLKVLDDGVSRSAAAYLRSTGSPGVRTTGQVGPQAEISHENLIFRIQPHISSVSAEFAGADPNFWNRR